MHCEDQRYLGLCLGYVTALAYGSCIVSDHGTTCMLLISAMHGQSYLIPLIKAIFKYNCGWFQHGITLETPVCLATHTYNHSTKPQLFSYRLSRKLFYAELCLKPTIHEDPPIINYCAFALLFRGFNMGTISYSKKFLWILPKCSDISYAVPLIFECLTVVKFYYITAVWRL